MGSKLQDSVADRNISWHVSSYTTLVDTVKLVLIRDALGVGAVHGLLYCSIGQPLVIGQFSKFVPVRLVV